MPERPPHPQTLPCAGLQERLLSTGGFDSSAPPILPLYSCTQTGAAAAPGEAELDAALALLADVLGGEAGLAAGAPAQAAAGAPDQAAAPPAAAPAAPQGAPAGPAAGACAAAEAAAADVLMDDALPADAVASAPSKAAPFLLLEVFEDRAPAAPGPAATTAAAAAAAALTAPPTAAEPPGARSKALSEPAWGQEAELAALRARVPQLPPSQARRELRRIAVVELTGRPMSDVRQLSKAQLSKLLKEAKRGTAAGEKQASAKQRRAAAATAQAALDRLFEPALGGDAAAWEAACAGLSQEERDALALREVDLEDYRRKIAAAAKLPGVDSVLQAAGASEDGGSDAGEEEEEGPARSGSRLGAGLSEGASSSDDERMGGGSAQDEAAAAAVAAAAAAHGGHYLRSCDAEAAAAAATGVPSAPGDGEEAQWFWEQQQARQRQSQVRPTRPERRQQGPAQPLSPLHFEVEAFAERATPTTQEVRCSPT